MAVTVRQITTAEATDDVRADLSTCLTASFLTYKAWTGMWTANPAITRILFDSTVAHAFDNEWEVWVAEEEGGIVGVAIWVPPAVEYTTSYLRAGFASLPQNYVQHFGTTISPEFRKLATILPGHDTEWWYLAFLGTHPDAKGKGVGSALLSKGAERAKGTPMALSTGSDKNQAFYEARGYAVRGQIRAPFVDGSEWTERLMTCPSGALPIGEGVKPFVGASRSG